jgi:hypothetical protein
LTPESKSVCEVKVFDFQSTTPEIGHIIRHLNVGPLVSGVKLSYEDLQILLPCTAMGIYRQTRHGKWGSLYRGMANRFEYDIYLLNYS